jgi:hypothetical protein
VLRRSASAIQATAGGLIATEMAWAASDVLGHRDRRCRRYVVPLYAYGCLGWRWTHMVRRGSAYPAFRHCCARARRSLQAWTPLPVRFGRRGTRAFGATARRGARGAVDRSRPCVGTTDGL